MPESAYFYFGVITDSSEIDSLGSPEPFCFGVNAGSSEIDSLGSPEPFCFGVNAGSSEIDSLGSISPAIEDDTVNIKTKATEV